MDGRPQSNKEFAGCLIILLICLVLLLLCSRASAQDIMTKYPGLVHIDTVYLTPPCPDAKVTAFRSNKPKSTLVPQVCSAPVMTLVKEPVLDTVAVNITINNIYTPPPSIVYVEPSISLKLLNQVDVHNGYNKKLRNRQIGALGLYLASAGAFIAGASRDYDFYSVANSDLVQYKDRGVLKTVHANNIAEVLREQERAKRGWYIAGGVLFVAATAVEISVIRDKGNELVVTPGSVVFKHTLKYKR